MGLWLLLVFFGVRFSEDNDKPLSLQNSVALRGICAIEIMLGHIGIATANMWLYPNRKAGILFVGIFFMLSGYGVAYSVEHKKDYKEKYLPGRISRLFLPAYITYFLSVVIDCVLFKNTDLYAIVNVFRFFRELNWYVWEQLFFYILFWIAIKLIPQYLKIVIVIGSVILIVAAFVMKLDNPWYGSALCFFGGLVFYEAEKREIELNGIKWWLVQVGLGVCLAISMILFFVLGEESVLGNPIARNVASSAFAIMVFVLLAKIKIGNSVSRFLGNNSYEIFLVHPYVIVWLQKVNVSNDVLFGALTIVITIMLSCIIHKLVKKINTEFFA